MWFDSTMTNAGAEAAATLTRSHELPDGSMPLGAMKEGLSKAYLRMLASATGLDVHEGDQDYDVRDVTLKSRVEYPALTDAGIDVQLKCTGQASAERENTIAWSLSKRTIVKMTQTMRATPFLLCVLVTDADAAYWLEASVEGLLARSHMYFMWGHELPAPILTQDSQTVHLPKSNVLTPATLLDLMEEASKWRAH